MITFDDLFYSILSMDAYNRGAEVGMARYPQSEIVARSILRTLR
jgi:hypothetical protein